jgi:predicted DNA-binding protein
VQPKNPKRADLNVRIPHDLMERLRDYSWTVNRPITKILVEALTQYLEGKKIKSRPIHPDE